MGNFPKLPEGTQLPVGGHQVTILKYLSEGGFAHIYKVKIDPKEEDTDIACLKRVIVPDKNGLNQLRKEVDVMKNLRYGRNIVKYYDSHAARLENGTYQVLVLMELCPNKSLLDYMNVKIKTKLTEPEILKIMLDISIGIYEMHKMKLVHRDIKIENVLIDAKNDFKLCDFGSTSSPIMPPKDQQQFQLLSHDIMYQTTPQYRAPEMIDLYRGFPIDEKADIWALGCFLYKLCYYTTPFEANGDIAILHATFQFLPAPVFSGDLKNLIIIMLQENPLFRPNIVQVLMLLCTMMKIEFKSLKLEDIYNTGPYNFHALHEYQRHKQNELLKQQQLYYQQNAYANGGKATSEVNLAKHYGNQIRLQNQSPFIRSQGGTPSQAYGQLNASNTADLQHQTQAELPAALSHDLEPQKNKQEAGVTLPNNEVNSETEDDNTSEIGLENLDNVEERYPSLEDLLEDPTKRTKSIDSDRVSQKDNAPPNLPNQNIRQPNMQNYGPQVPTQPVILSNADLQKLTPDQFQQYHYQHQAYQYQLDQYQKQLYQQNEQQKHQQANALNPNSIDHNITTGKSKEPSEFEKKEAWERHHSKIEKDAELLVDDIFATNSKSPALAPVQVQNTNQSAKGDIESLSKLKKSVSSEYPSTSSDGHLKQHGEICAEDSIEPSIGAHNAQDAAGVFNDDGKEISSRSRHSLDGHNLRPEGGHDQRDVFINDASNKVNDVDSFESFSGKYPDILSNMHIDAPFNSSPQTKVSNNLNIPSINSSSTAAKYPFTYQQPSQQNVAYSNPKPDVNANKSDIRKHANPWGDYTKNANVAPVKRVSSHSGIVNSQPASISNEPAPIIPVHEQMNALSLKERPSSMQQRGNSNEQSSEANLIDLEVGLESSSSSTNTPALNPKTKDLYKLNTESSLSGFDLDDEKKPSESKHQFKKRLSSAQNPSSFSFQEEVIDFASDDENPENSSEMNRLSIRNSLSKKPKSRKSSEHKRSDSANSEGKKRLSLFGSSQGN